MFDTGPDDKQSVNDRERVCHLGVWCRRAKKHVILEQKGVFYVGFFWVGGRKGEIVREVGKRGETHFFCLM